MIITVSGFIGSGKTTVARSLARHYGLKHISAGEAFRELAKEKRLSLEEFSRLAEENPAIDREIDARQREKAMEGDVVAEGRLSGWLIEADFKVWLEASLRTRARRVARREKKNYREALRETRKREESEIRRYREIYGIDLRDLTPYNVIIDTEFWNAEEVVKLIKDIVDSVHREGNPWMRGNS